MVQVLADNLPMILAAALQLMLQLAKEVDQALPVLIEALPQIIQALVDFIIAAIPMIIDAGIQLLTSIVTALPTIDQGHRGGHPYSHHQHRDRDLGCLSRSSSTPVSSCSQP